MDEGRSAGGGAGPLPVVGGGPPTAVLGAGGGLDVLGAAGPGAGLLGTPAAGGTPTDLSLFSAATAPTAYGLTAPQTPSQAIGQHRHHCFYDPMPLAKPTPTPASG